MSNARKLADLVSDGLDDYEEGNWTPTFENTSGGTTSGKYKPVDGYLLRQLQIVCFVAAC